MAPRSRSPGLFHCDCGVAHSGTLLSKAALHTALSSPRAVLASGLLYTSSFLFCRAHSAGQCFDAKQLEAIRTSCYYSFRNAAYRKAVRKGRTKARRQGRDSSPQVANFRQSGSGKTHLICCLNGWRLAELLLRSHGPAVLRGGPGGLSNALVICVTWRGLSAGGDRRGVFYEILRAHGSA